MNRGLVLYRLAEMMEARRAQFVERLRAGTKLDEIEALRETTAAIDRALWYAGWCDKYAAVLSSRNPVAGPYYNYSTPEPMGVVGVIAPITPNGAGSVSVSPSSPVTVCESKSSVPGVFSVTSWFLRILSS